MFISVCQASGHTKGVPASSILGPHAMPAAVNVFLYTEMLYKSHAGSAGLTFIKVRCFIQMYTEVLGVLHHLLARGPADNL